MMLLNFLLSTKPFWVPDATVLKPFRVSIAPTTRRKGAFRVLKQIKQ
jgi:hypothetical protein